MEDHIRELLNRYQYSEEVKEAVAFRVLFGGEDAKQIMQELGIHSVKTIHHWIADYQQKIEQGLISLPPMNEKQKQSLEALRWIIRSMLTPPSGSKSGSDLAVAASGNF